MAVCEKTNLMASGITPLVLIYILEFIHVISIYFEPKVKMVVLHS